MFYVYILQSKKDNNWYIGSTNNLARRFAEHNEGKVTSTAFRMPFKIFYYEAYISAKDARNREHNLKLHSRAFTQLKKRLEDSINMA